MCKLDSNKYGNYCGHERVPFTFCFAVSWVRSNTSILDVGSWSGKENCGWFHQQDFLSIHEKSIVLDATIISTHQMHISLH